MSSMRESKRHDWLQLAGLFGVIAGLVLVAYEVRQANTIAEAEAIRSLYEGWDNVQIPGFESEFFEIYVKSFEDPQSLSSVEIMKMDAWLASHLNQYDRQLVMQKLDLDPYDAVEHFLGSFDVYFGSEFSRAWYVKGARYWLEPELVEVIDREIAARPVQSSPKFVEDIRSLILDKKDQSNSVN